MAVLAVVALLAAGVEPLAQSGLPNPYPPRQGTGRWRGPERSGRRVGQASRRERDRTAGLGARRRRRGELWALIRCDETSPVPVAAGGRFGIDCLGRDNKIKNIDTVFKFDAKGNVVKSFGSGMFIWPHGLHVDRDGNVWVTDAVAADGVAMAAKAGVRAGHQVVKFSPEGKVLMTLGRSGGPRRRSVPLQVAERRRGGRQRGYFRRGWPRHQREQSRHEVPRRTGSSSRRGERPGTGPGEFRTMHALAIDSRGRVFVADRANNRIQLFDQEGKFLAIWTQFGTPSGIFFDDKDRIYVADSESDQVNNPGWEQGIRIGDARTGWVTAFILDQGGNPNTQTGSGPEFVTADRHGNVFGEPPGVLRKYVKVR